jgi:two-component system nitrate/nitrite response regulator NarL
MSDAHARTRILIADDHPLFRAGLLSVLEDHESFLVVGEASNGLEAIDLAHQTIPDILLLDVAMPVLSGFEVLRGISDLERNTRSIVLTANISKAEMIHALQLGARGVLWKNAVACLLVKSIECVMAGQIWISRETIGDLVNALRGSPVPQSIESVDVLVPSEGSLRDSGSRKFGLTDREVEIVNAIMDGQSNRDIALANGISQYTVKHHLTHIFDKVGVYSRLELAVFAMHHGLNTSVSETAAHIREVNCTS